MGTCVLVYVAALVIVTTAAHMVATGKRARR
jgi:hypothetical protein